MSQKRTTVGEPGEDLNGPRIKFEEPNLIGCDAVGLKYSNLTPFSTGIPLKSRPEHRPVTKSTLFKPTLYKSHCEGSFMCEPNNINGPQRNRVPTLFILFYFFIFIVVLFCKIVFFIIYIFFILKIQFISE